MREELSQCKTKVRGLEECLKREKAELRRLKLVSDNRISVLTQANKQSRRYFRQWKLNADLVRSAAERISLIISTSDDTTSDPFIMDLLSRLEFN